MGRFIQAANLGAIELPEMIAAFEAGVRFSWGTPPEMNSDGLEEFVALKDLKTSLLSIAVAERLKQIVLTLEQEAFPTTANAHRNDQLIIAQSALRLLALVHLTDFVGIESQRLRR